MTVATPQADIERRTPDPPVGAFWHRAAEVVDVSFPKREIELVVIPYDTPAVVRWNDRMVEETIDPAAFRGIEKRPNRVKVNREHINLYTVGKALAFHPSRSEGLVAQIRIAATPLGDETLTLAEGGDLDASAGFRPMDGGMTWQTRNRYRVTKAWLGHIAMTSDPAYPDARVLAVRSEQSAPPDVPDPPTRPNLTSLSAQTLQAQFDALEARWS